MKVLLSVSLWLAVTMLACCAGNNDQTVLNPDYMNATDYDTYSDNFFWSKASGIGQLNLVFLLGLAVLQIWN